MLFLFCYAVYISWNGALVNHSTFIFFDELSAIHFWTVARFPFANIYDNDSGALVCMAHEPINQNWYYTNEVLFDKVALDLGISAHNSIHFHKPDYARINRFYIREPPVQTLEEQMYNGLWSCRYGTDGETDGAVYVGVYERPGGML